MNLVTLHRPIISFTANPKKDEPEELKLARMNPKKVGEEVLRNAALFYELNARPDGKESKEFLASLRQKAAFYRNLMSNSKLTRDIGVLIKNTLPKPTSTSGN